MLRHARHARRALAGMVPRAARMFDKTGAGRGAARLLWCTLVVVRGVLGEGLDDVPAALAKEAAGQGGGPRSGSTLRRAAPAKACGHAWEVGLLRRKLQVHHYQPCRAAKRQKIHR